MIVKVRWKRHIFSSNCALGPKMAHHELKLYTKRSETGWYNKIWLHQSQKRLILSSNCVLEPKKTPLSAPRGRSWPHASPSPLDPFAYDLKCSVLSRLGNSRFHKEKWSKNCHVHEGLCHRNFPKVSESFAVHFHFHKFSISLSFLNTANVYFCELTVRFHASNCRQHRERMKGNRCDCSLYKVLKWD